MIAALLHGRTHLNFHEFRQQNHLTFFLHVLGVLELLQPQVFRSEHQGALWDCLRSFIRLLLVSECLPAAGPDCDAAGPCPLDATACEAEPPRGCTRGPRGGAPARVRTGLAPVLRIPVLAPRTVPFSASGPHSCEVHPIQLPPLLPRPGRSTQDRLRSSPPPRPWGEGRHRPWAFRAPGTLQESRAPWLASRTEPGRPLGASSHAGRPHILRSPVGARSAFSAVAVAL